MQTRKDYKNWMGVKTKINNANLNRMINEGDVVWVAIGENVGVEMDGKSEKYSRPVIVLRKHSNLCFTGIPLTSQSHDGTWYHQFNFQGKTQIAVLIQTKLIDTKRVYSRIGKLSKTDYNQILISYVKLILGKKYALAKD